MITKMPQKITCGVFLRLFCGGSAWDPDYVRWTSKNSCTRIIPISEPPLSKQTSLMAGVRPETKD